MTDWMPQDAPLAMPTQDLHAAPDCADLQRQGHPMWRVAVFVPALALTAVMVWQLHDLLGQSGMSWLEYLLLGLIATTFIWITLSVSTACIGLWRRRNPAAVGESGQPLSVALLMPVCNEAASDVFGNAQAMLADLHTLASDHRFSLFILSDSLDPAMAAQEDMAFAALRKDAPAGINVYYRRRAQNTDKKVGNLVDWITRYGAAHDAMLVLDADSLMTGQAIVRLTDALAADPQTGLVQSFPQLLAEDTLFARLQQFSHTAYGWLLAEGLAAWAQTEGNYWGHNAIIRTRAFAAAAGLPYLRGWRGRSSLILSHDFVEASLLRRSGWRVRFLPRMSGSYEETPGTLIDYVLRDRRWCRGNMQHLRLLGTAGLHPVSRFHLFQGAASYLMSPAWFALLIFWALLGRDSETNVIAYFSETNPLFPNWPPAMTHIDSAMFLLVMYAMLLAPKITGASIIVAHRKAVRLYGGRLAFLSAFVVELALSVAYAPILMIQQTKSVLRTIVTREGGWKPQQRAAQAHPFRTLLAFHWLETLLGCLLLSGIALGLISLWLLPIMASLLCAIPLSALSAVSLSRHLPRALRLETPYTLREPSIRSRARRARDGFARHLETLAAE